jgi:hypothetical protein
MVVRGKRLLVTVPELKKASVELSVKDEELRMQDAIKVWTKLEIFAVGNEVEGIKAGDIVYIQTYALESAERIEIDGVIKLLIPEQAVAIIY